MASVYPLPGKVALVTGAARGIGFETARLLHDRGASVAVVDLDSDASGRAAAAAGERTLGLAADVTDAAAMETVVAEVVERFGGLDVVVANAGVGPPPSTMRVADPEAFERALEVNLMGTWRTVQPALEQLAERQGQAVLISSIYAWMNGAGVGAYAAGKAGVEAMGRALRAELAIHGAGATVAHFGWIDTQMVRQGFSHPASQRFAEVMPGFMRKRLTAAQAAAALVAGIERRAPRVITPGWWKLAYALRGVVGPLLDAALARQEVYREVMRVADDPRHAAGTEGLTRAAGAEDAATPAGAA